MPRRPAPAPDRAATVRGHAARSATPTPRAAIHREVVLRKMTGREEAILADRSYQRNGGKLVTELLHSCIVRARRPRGRTAADRWRTCTPPTATTCCSSCAASPSAPSSRRPTPARRAASSMHGDRGPRRAAGAAVPDGEEHGGDRGRARGRLRRPRRQVHTALMLRLPDRRGRGGGRAADAGERLARQERAAGALHREPRRRAAPPARGARAADHEPS